MELSGERKHSNSAEICQNFMRIFRAKVKQTPSNDNAAKLRMLEEYIEQDGCEKANEIDIKSEEEVRIIISSRLVEVGRHFEELKQKTLRKDTLVNSKIRNSWRLYILVAKQQILNQLIKIVKQRFIRSLEDPGIRRVVLEKLMLQAAIKMMEPRVVIRVLEKDFPLADEIILRVREKYVERTGLPVKLVLDTLYPLPEKTGGGVHLRTPDHRIYVTNFLSKKIELLVNSVHPMIRHDLFEDNICSIRFPEQQSTSDYYSISNTCDCR